MPVACVRQQLSAYSCGDSAGMAAPRRRTGFPLSPRYIVVRGTVAQHIVGTAEMAVNGGIRPYRPAGPVVAADDTGALRLARIGSGHPASVSRVPEHATCEQESGADPDVHGAEDACSDLPRMHHQASQRHPAPHHERDERPGTHREEAEEPGGPPLADPGDRLHRHPLEYEARLQHAEREARGKCPGVPGTALDVPEA